MSVRIEDLILEMAAPVAAAIIKYEEAIDFEGLIRELLQRLAAELRKRGQTRANSAQWMGLPERVFYRRLAAVAEESALQHQLIAMILGRLSVGTATRDELLELLPNVDATVIDGQIALLSRLKLVAVAGSKGDEEVMRHRSPSAVLPDPDVQLLVRHLVSLHQPISTSELGRISGLPMSYLQPLVSELEAAGELLLGADGWSLARSFELWRVESDSRQALAAHVHNVRLLSDMTVRAIDGLSSERLARLGKGMELLVRRRLDVPMGKLGPLSDDIATLSQKARELSDLAEPMRSAHSHRREGQVALLLGFMVLEDDD